MDKIKTNYKGGMPALQEHFAYMQEAYSKAFEAIVKSFDYNEPGYILYGCHYTETSTDYTIEPGAVVLNGEILIVDGHTVTKQSGTLISYFWGVEETDDPNGEMAFYDGDTYNVYARRRGIIKVSTPPLGSYMVLGQEKRIPDLIDGLVGDNYVAKKLLSWISPVLLNGWTHQLANGKQGLLYTKQANGIVRVIGYILPSSATNHIITQLPQGYRPPFPVQSNWIDLNGKLATVETTGEVQINNYNTADSAGYYIHLEFPTL
ncbi:MAG: hypothetical protein K9J21_10520 [Bacteroidales bacterium]|nr:hypothetical protein [Bacteroidales bacterium]